MRGEFKYPGANWPVGSRRRAKPKDKNAPSSIVFEHVVEARRKADETAEKAREEARLAAIEAEREQRAIAFQQFKSEEKRRLGERKLRRKRQGKWAEGE